MSMLTASELAAMQTTQALALPDTAIIYRAINVKDGAGLYSEIWGTAAAIGTVACRAMPQLQRGRAEIVAGEQITAIARWDITMPVGTDVRVTDRVGVNGRMFELERVNTAESWQTATRIEAVLINSESTRE